MSKFRPLPPLERLRELFEVVEIPPDKYGKWSGLIRKVSRRGHQKGSVAGSLRRPKERPNRAEWRTAIDGVKYMTSRVIYYMTYGKDPGDIEVDHKDLNTLNNNKWNLRLDIDGEIQKVNRETQSNNTSGAVGVSWSKAREKWKTYAQVRSKLKHLGYFTCKIEAARAVNQKWIELGWPELGRRLHDLEAITCGCEKCK